MHIKVEIEVPPEQLAKPDIPRLVQEFVTAICAGLLTASAKLSNGDGNGTRSSDAGTSDTTSG